MLEKPDTGDHCHSRIMEDADTNYVFGEVNVTAGGGPTGEAPGIQPKLSTYTERASLEEIVAIAKQLWGRVKKSGISETDDAGNDKLLADLREDDEFRKFATSFPLVMRWIVQARKYNLNALKSYLRKHASADLKTREAFLDLQAEYLVMVYKEEHTHANPKKVKLYRESIVTALRREDKEFTTMNEQVEEEMKTRSKAVDKIRRDELRAMLLAIKIQREAAKAADQKNSPTTTELSQLATEQNSPGPGQKIAPTPEMVASILERHKEDVATGKALTRDRIDTSSSGDSPISTGGKTL